MTTIKIALIITSIPLVALALLCSIVMSNNSSVKKNGFKRKKLNSNLVLLQELKISEPYYKICGLTKHNIFLTGKDPKIFSVVNQELENINSYYIKLPTSTLLSTGFFVDIDSPMVRIYDYNKSYTFTYNMSDSVASSIKLQTGIFTKYCKLPDNTLIIRGFKKNGKKQMFQKLALETGLPLKNAEIISTEGDAGFSSDGTICYDSETNSLLYVQYYQNKFYCLDTNLSIKYSGKTIDTVNTNPVNTKIFSKDEQGSLMSSVPLKIVNQQCQAYQGYLFVLSKLRADNETISYYRKNTPLDVYNISDGKYLGSVYIPLRGSEDLLTFALTNESLITITSAHIYKFSIGLTSNK